MKFDTVSGAIDTAGVWSKGADKTACSALRAGPTGQRGRLNEARFWANESTRKTVEKTDSWFF